MFKFSQMARACGGIQIPLANMNCEKCLLQRIDRWLFIRQQREREEEAKKQLLMKKQKNLNLMIDYKLEYMQEKLRKEAERNKRLQRKIKVFKTPKYVKGYIEYLSTPEFKRISPELLTMMKKLGHGVPGGDVPRDGLPRDGKPRGGVSRDTADEKQSTKKNTTELGSFKKETLDEVNPVLAKYLRNVMESGTMLNDIYGIDYYQHDTVAPLADETDTEEANSFQYMDPNDIAYLFDLLHQKKKLNSSQKQHLNNFMRDIAKFDPPEIKEYLGFLQNRGILTDDTVNFLTAGVQYLSPQLGDPQFNRLMDVFGNDAEMKTLVKNNRQVPLLKRYPNTKDLLTYVPTEKLGSRYFDETGRNDFFGEDDYFYKTSHAKHTEGLESAQGFDIGRMINPWNVLYPWKDLNKFPKTGPNLEKIEHLRFRDDIRQRLKYQSFSGDDNENPWVAQQELLLERQENKIKQLEEFERLKLAHREMKEILKKTPYIPDKVLKAPRHSQEVDDDNKSLQEKEEQLIKRDISKLKTPKNIEEMIKIRPYVSDNLYNQRLYRRSLSQSQDLSRKSGVLEFRDEEKKERASLNQGRGSTTSSNSSIRLSLQNN